MTLFINGDNFGTIIDPSSSESIAYSPMQRTDLESWIASKGLEGKGMSKINPDLLDKLYNAMDLINELFLEGKLSMVSQGAGLDKISEAAFNDNAGY